MKIRQKLAYTTLFASAFALATTVAVAQEAEHAPAHDAPAHEAAPETGHAAPAVDHAAAGTEHAVQGAEHAQDEHGAAEHGEHAGAEHDEHGGHHGPAPMNWTDFSDKKRPAFLALLINAGLLFGLYYVIGKKPVAEGLKQRRVTIGKDIDDARRMLEEAKERAKKYQGDLKNADADAETARTALVDAGQGDADKLLRDAKERSERMSRDAERLVEQERRQFENDLRVETVELALSEATKLLEKSITPDDHARLANDLLAELARRPAAEKVASRTGGAS